MRAIVCNNCKKVIEEDDIEAIEVLMPLQRRFNSDGQEDFKPTQTNTYDVDQSVHFCGECTVKFYDLLG